MLEQELKFFVPENARPGLLTAFDAVRTGSITLNAIYFDTPERDLARSSIALRLRKEGEQWVQTVKLLGPDTLSRIEINHPRPGPELDLDLYQDTPAQAPLARYAGQIQARYQTRIQRELALIDPLTETQNNEAVTDFFAEQENQPQAASITPSPLASAALTDAPKLKKKTGYPWKLILALVLFAVLFLSWKYLFNQPVVEQTAALSAAEPSLAEIEDQVAPVEDEEKGSEPSPAPTTSELGNVEKASDMPMGTDRSFSSIWLDAVTIRASAARGLCGDAFTKA